MKTFFLPPVSFLLKCCCSFLSIYSHLSLPPPGYHHFILPADFFITYTDSLIIVSCLEKPWQFHKSMQGKLAPDVTNVYEPLSSEESLLSSFKGEYLE